MRWPNPGARLTATPSKLSTLAVAMASIVATTAIAALTVATPPASAASPCQVDYRINNPWPGGFTATVTLTVATARNGWTLTWVFPNDQKITNFWSSVVTAPGPGAVSVHNETWNGTLAAGGSVEFGFQASVGATNQVPTAFAVDGVACNGATPSSSAPAGSSQPPSSQPPSSQPASSRPPSSQPASSQPPSSQPPSSQPPTGCSGAALCDGFETQTGTTPAGSWTTSAPNCSGTGTVSVDSSVAHSGGKSVRVNGGIGFCNHIFIRTTQGVTGSVLFGRYYVRHSTLLPPDHVTFMALRDSADAGGKDLRMGGQNQNLQWNRESDDATLPAQSPAGVAQSRPLPINTWSCVEFMIDSGRGQLRTWLNSAEVPGLVEDGTPTPDIDNQWLARANWRPTLTDFRLGWESYGNGGDTLWYDDVALGASRIGC
jgi:hypothetical protein